MKTITSFATGIICMIALATTTGCKKKSAEADTNSTCKTCKAFATQSDLEVVKQVCSDKAEQDFRKQYASREVSCY